METGAQLTECRTYRLALWRIWGAGAPLVFILLNPSTADAAQDDPTLGRCMARARAAGHGGVHVANLFAFRATDPRAPRRAADPVGPGNDAAIDRAAGLGPVICGWGNGGALMGRGAAVATRLHARGIPLHHLGLTGQGAPRHPLYVAGAQVPVPWQKEAP